MQLTRTWTRLALALITASIATSTGCKPSPTKVVDHYLSLAQTGNADSPAARIRRATLLINANRLRREDPAEYAFAARCVLDLQSARQRPPSECLGPMRRMFADAREVARSDEREAPTQSCVYSPTSDERSAAGCRRRCGGRADQGCFGPCAIQAAIRINSAMPGCGTSF
jgi:hypothetical protein